MKNEKLSKFFILENWFFSGSFKANLVRCLVKVFMVRFFEFNLICLKLVKRYKSFFFEIEPFLIFGNDSKCTTIKKCSKSGHAMKMQSEEESSVTEKREMEWSNGNH